MFSRPEKIAWEQTATVEPRSNLDLVEWVDARAPPKLTLSDSSPRTTTISVSKSIDCLSAIGLLKTRYQAVGFPKIEFSSSEASNDFVSKLTREEGNCFKVYRTFRQMGSTSCEFSTYLIG